MIILIALGAFIATFLGGLLALKFKDKLHLILGFSAGAVVGVVFFDLIPEALDLTSDRLTSSQTLSIIALGFVVYMIVFRYFHAKSHSHDHDDGECCSPKGSLGAGSLSIHSFIDGLGIGLAFQVSTVVGVIVAVAVLVHDFSDGINTVGMILKNNGDQKTALKWLAMDSIAPALGVLCSTLFIVDDFGLGVTLAVFAGFFLYIGASDLLPESHHNHPTKWTTVMSVAGILVIYFAIKLAGI
ncbi:MAG: ZIP family metal transporter [bacterium]